MIDVERKHLLGIQREVIDGPALGFGPDVLRFFYGTCSGCGWRQVGESRAEITKAFVDHEKDVEAERAFQLMVKRLDRVAV